MRMELVALIMALLASSCLAYVIEGDQITFSNSYGSISQYPHTLRDSGEWAYINATSNLTGPISLDFAFGFDTSVIRPTEARFWTGADWTDISSQFSQTAYNGKTIYIVSSSFVLGQTKQMKIKLDIAPNSTGKYDLYIKRSSDSWSSTTLFGGPNPIVVLDPWWNSTFNIKIKMSLNSTVSTVLTNYPAHISFDHQSLVSSYGCLPNGSDIRIVNETNTTLSFDLATATLGTTNAHAWVRIPSFPNGIGAGMSNYTVYLYCGNNTPVSSVENSCDTWGPAGYKRVYLMDEGDWSGTLIDSSCNSNGTYNGTTNTWSTVKPLFGGNPRFQGSTYADVLNFSNPHLANTTGNVSISIWYWRNSTGACGSSLCGLFGDYVGAPDYGMLTRVSAGPPAITQASPNSGTVIVNATTYNDTWNLVQISIEKKSTNYETRIYNNGTLSQSSNATTVAYGNNSFFIGIDAWSSVPSRNWVGFLSHFRYRNETSSANWLLADARQTSVSYAIERIPGYNGTLIACSGSAVRVLNFTLFDEETLLPMNGTFEMTFSTTTGGNLSQLAIQKNNSQFAEVCIDTSASQLQIYSFQAYQSNLSISVYPPRNYFLLNATVNATILQTVPLYLENGTLSRATTIFVRDQSAKGQGGVYVSFERYYPGENVYRLVAMTKTDTNGYGTTYLRPRDSYYRATVYDSNGRVIQQFEPSFLPCDPSSYFCSWILQINNQDYGTYWRTIDTISSICNYTNSTPAVPRVQCTYIDTSGLSNNIVLEVWKMNIVSKTLNCSNGTTGPSGLLTCYLGSSPTGQYTFTLIDNGPTSLILNGGSVNFGQAVIFGQFGLFMAVILIVSLAFAGLWTGSPPVVLVMGFVGFIASVSMGLMVVGMGAIVGVAIGVVISVYTMRHS